MQLIVGLRFVNDFLIIHEFAYNKAIKQGELN